MRIFRSYCAAIIGIIVGFSIVGSAGAKPEESGKLSGLAGRVFAVEAEVLFSLDPNLPQGVTFENCYTFNDDGSWEDPLFPDPAASVPGVWIQHAELPRILYTATIASLAPDVLLIQNGTVIPARGKGKQQLTAYTTAFTDGDTLVIEVMSKGYAVETCPFF